jgi:autotransporter-associated beta strand protein
MKQNLPRPPCIPFSALILLLVALLPGALFGADVVINEIMSSNSATAADEDGHYSDWVELYNRGDEAVDLAGWGFSDRDDNPFKWTIGAAVIPPQGRLLIWASGKDRPGPDSLHAGFAISADGENLVLTRPDGSTSDWIAALAIPRDISFGRFPDGAEDMGFFAAPTPLAANPAEASDAILAAPDFSHARGHYDEPFDLVLSHEDPGALLFYTLNGSAPTEAAGIPYSGPIRIGASAVVRAAAFREGALPLGNSATMTYLFLDDIIARDHTPPPGYPSVWWNSVSGSHVSYGQSPVVMARPGYAERMKEALLEVPSVSLVLPVSDLFGSGGIYSNPTRLVDDHGPQWEKAASMEWIDPDSGNHFGAGVGLRIQGAGSRGEDSTPKKSFRVLFKGEYGPGRLNQPVLAEAGTLGEDFNSLIFRAEYNNSWLHWASEQREAPQFGMYLADQWIKNRQKAMSGLGLHGRHVHLFVNGIYWGVYNFTERTDAAWAAGQLGGEREEYDAVGWRGMRDGDWDRWKGEIESVVARDLSSNDNYLALQAYLDVDHFIDYNLLQMFAGNQDWPRNNWTAVRHREDGRVYHVAWDTERSFEDVTHNVVTKAWDPPRVVGDPPTFFRVLRDNAEFRLRFADRAHRHLFNGGALTPEVTVPELAAAAARARPVIFAEEARWGAYRKEIRERRSPSYYYGVESHWDPALQRMLEDYLPQRPGILVEQLRAAGLYPQVDAPELAFHGGGFVPGESLGITNPNAGGTIYYTTDGTDPRTLGGGAVAPGAQAYAGALPLTRAVVLKARVLQGGDWSALTEAAFFPDEGELQFLPGVTEDWTNAANWDGSHYPDGPGAAAAIAAPSPDLDRNINLRQPVAVGSLRFEQGASAARNRVRDRDTGNSLTLADPAGLARIEVNGTGTGFVEFEVEAGVMLESDLELDIRNTAGHPDHGALRLRGGWQGAGGLLKTGPGVASLTGDGKHFIGAVAIDEGVLQVTEPATPRFARGVSVAAGGQLRLTSGSGGGDTRRYGFGGRLQLAGGGRDSGLPAGDGYGLLGALRYEPGSNDNHAIVTNTIEISAPASIHVDGTRNLLELTGPLGGVHGFIKSGGGTLLLNGQNGLYAGAVTVSNGALRVAGALGSAIEVEAAALLGGDGRAGPLSGQGQVLIDGGILHAPSADGLSYAVMLAHPGDTRQFEAPGWGNGLLRLDAAPGNVGMVSFYVTAPGQGEPEQVFRGGLFVPPAADLEGALASAFIRVFIPDPGGAHAFAGQLWTLSGDAAVTVVDGEGYFDNGYGTGKTLRVAVPSADPVSGYAAWRIAQFPDPADQADPAVSGPFATPLDDGVSNLARYALDLDWDQDVSPYHPSVAIEEGRPVVALPVRADRADLVTRLLASDDLADWEQVLFDSLVDPVEPDPRGWIRVADDGPDGVGVRRFYRVEIRFREGGEP